MCTVHRLGDFGLAKYNVPGTAADATAEELAAAAALGGGPATAAEAAEAAASGVLGTSFYISPEIENVRPSSSSSYTTHCSESVFQPLLQISFPTHCSKWQSCKFIGTLLIKHFECTAVNKLSLVLSPESPETLTLSPTRWALRNRGP